jgi:hypothetical protein
MKYKIVSMKFCKPLTEEQENILIGAMQGMIEGAEKELDRILKKFDKPAIQLVKKFGQNEIIIETFKTKLIHMRNNLTLYFVLQKKGEKEYEFSYPEEKITLGVSNFFGKKIKVGKLVTQNKFISWIRGYILPKMDLDPRSVRFISGEEERANINI